MANAADVQIMTGPSASFVHHIAAGVQSATGLDAVWSLGITIGLGIVGVVGLAAGVAMLLGDDPEDVTQ